MLTPRLLLATLLSLATVNSALSQNWQHPRIPDYGGIVAIPDAALMPDASRAHRIVFDLASAKTRDGVNEGLWYLARLRNLLELAGVPADSIQLVGVLHGGATDLSLSDASSQTRSGAPNPNLPLMRALAMAGTTFYLCGQSAAANGIDIATDLNDVTTPALSAMTTLIALKEVGYVTP